MKIQKLIFENSYQPEHFVKDKGFDFLMKIETEDSGFIKERVVNLGILRRNTQLRFEILTEILNFFSDIISKEKLEIDELIFQIHSDNKEFTFIQDIWNSYFGLEEKLKYRKDLIRKIHIKNMNFTVAQSTKHISLEHIGCITDSIKINVLSQNEIESISINSSINLNINGGGNNIKEIRIGDLTENQEIGINNLKADNIQILNLLYPPQKRQLKKLEILSSTIGKIELRGFDESMLYIGETRFWSTTINGGIIENIEFEKISLVDSRITDTGFFDLIFPRENTNFLVKNLKMERNTYSNISWGNYFSEYDSSTYTKDGKIIEKKWFISKGGLKETYRMLKYEHDEIGNKTEANKFFAKEMEYYRKSLLDNYTWKTFFDADIGQKRLVSILNQISNNYGNSWLRPLIWIIIVSFLYTYLSDCWDFKCTCGGVQDWSCFSSHWLKNVSQFPTELRNAKDWWFLLYAIIMGSLFYQLLVALRRISQR